MKIESKDIIRQYRKYHLSPFKEILTEILDHFDTLENLQNLRVLELGPGSKVNLMRFLVNETEISCIKGIGRSPVLPWHLHKQFIRDNCINTLLLLYLKKEIARSFDLIYSRHLMEQNSIHPGILITSPVYWKYIRENRFQNPGTDFPSSKLNIQAIFIEAYRILKPGGIIISQIAKKNYSCIDDDFIKKLKPKKGNARNIGKLSQVVTLIK